VLLGVTLQVPDVAVAPKLELVLVAFVVDQVSTEQVPAP
jgi:hypothetical protein